MRRLYYPKGSENNVALPIENGGSGATTIPEATENLGPVTNSMMNRANGVAMLDESGNISFSNLPESVAMLALPSILGPLQVYTNQTVVFTITNYDTNVEYVISATGGNVNVIGDEITMAVGSAEMIGSIVINDLEYEIEILQEVVEVPSISYPTNEEVIASQQSITFVASQFVGSIQGSSHLMSDWQLATDVQFDNIVDSSPGSTTNLTSWVVNGLLPDTDYYVRVQYYSDFNTASGWSAVSSFSMTDTLKLFSSAGAFSYTIPAGIAAVEVKYGGGGGGGGGGTAGVYLSLYEYLDYPGGGGGSSGGQLTQSRAVTPGGVISGTIGAGGARGLSGIYQYTWYRDMSPLSGVEEHAVYHGTPGGNGAQTVVSYNGSAFPAAPGGNGGGAPVPTGGAAVAGGNAGVNGGKYYGGRGGHSLIGTGGPGGGHYADGSSGGPGAGGGGAGDALGNNTGYDGGLGGSGYVQIKLIPLSEVQPHAPFTQLVSATAFNMTADASLQSSVFTTPSTDTHASTDWQIASDVNFTNIVKSSTGDTTNKLSWSTTGLLSNTTYYARCRHNGATYAPGKWSQAISFVTAVNQFEYAASGTYSLTIPLGIGSIDIQYLVAGGGGGAQGDTQGPGESGETFIYTGGGGGGSGNKTASSIAVVAGDVISIQVGAGGIARNLIANSTDNGAPGDLSRISKNGSAILTQLGANGATKVINANGQGASAVDGGTAGAGGGSGGTGGNGVSTPIGVRGRGGNGGVGASALNPGGYNATSGTLGYARIKLNLVNPPSQPSITYPTEGATGFGPSITLTSSAFYSSSSETHLNTDWEIATDSGFANIVKSSYNNATNKTSWTASGLSANTQYYSRVRHRSNSSTASTWSPTRSFRTHTSFAPTKPTATAIWNSIFGYYEVTTSAYSSPVGSAYSLMEYASTFWTWTSQFDSEGGATSTTNSPPPVQLTNIGTGGVNDYAFKCRYRDAAGLWSTWSDWVKLPGFPEPS